MKWTPQNFAHDMTAVLSWHVQKFVVICLTKMELKQKEFSTKLEFEGGTLTVKQALLPVLNNNSPHIEGFLLQLAVSVIQISRFSCVASAHQTTPLVGDKYICWSTVSPTNKFLNKFQIWLKCAYLYFHLYQSDQYKNVHIPKLGMCKVFCYKSSLLEIMVMKIFSAFGIWLKYCSGIVVWSKVVPLSVLPY